MRRCATSETTMTRAKKSTSPYDPMLGQQSMYQPRPRGLRNPDQLRRRGRYHRAMGEFKCKLDNKPQLTGRMTREQLDSCQRSKKRFEAHSAS